MDELNELLTTVSIKSGAFYCSSVDASHDEYLYSVHPLQYKKGPHSSKSPSTCTIKMIHRKVSLALTNTRVGSSITFAPFDGMSLNDSLLCTRSRALPA